MRDIITIVEAPAYHGSPHEFASFDTSYIGTGEGNSSYGWGLYFAEVHDVADKYSRDIADAGHFFNKSGKELKLPALEVEMTALVRRKVEQGTPDIEFTEDSGETWLASTATVHNAMLLLKRGIGAGMAQALRANAKSYHKEMAIFWKLLAAYFARLEWRPGKARIYHVDISDTSSFLDWKANMSEQPAIVQSVASDLKAGRDIGQGAELYRWLTERFGSQKAASVYLLNHGVEGIRYPDAGSRRNVTPSYNYVVFNHRLVTISKVA